jgi:uncharacterized protein YecT (DUF1311 family)
MNAALSVLLSFACLVFAARPAHAVEGDVTFPSAPSREQAVYGKARVVLYGPVQVTPQLKNSTGTIAFSFEGVDTGGEILSAQLFLVDPSHQAKGPYAIDPANAFGDLSGMEGSPFIPMDLFEEVHDIAGKDHPHLPFTHLRQWDSVMLAVAVDVGHVKIGRIVLTPDLTAFAAEKAPSPTLCWNAARTRDDLITCSGRDPKALDAHLAEAVAKLNASLQPKFRARLKASEAAWQKGRDTSCSLFADTTSGCDGQGPTCAIRISMTTECLLEASADRVLFLREFLRFP